MLECHEQLALAEIIERTKQLVILAYESDSSYDGWGTSTKK